MALQDKDRIFTNLYGYPAAGTWPAAQKRGDWDNTKALLDKGHDGSSTRSRPAGLRGRGGAGFPTGMKWSFMPKEYRARAPASW